MNNKCQRSTPFTQTPEERALVSLFRILDTTIEMVVPREKWLAILLYGPTPQERATLHEMAVVTAEMAIEGHAPTDIAQYLRQSYLPPEWM